MQHDEWYILWGPYSNNMTTETLDLYCPLHFYGFEGGGAWRHEGDFGMFLHIFW